MYATANFVRILLTFVFRFSGSDVSPIREDSLPLGGNTEGQRAPGKGEAGDL